MKRLKSDMTPLSKKKITRQQENHRHSRKAKELIFNKIYRNKLLESFGTKSLQDIHSELSKSFKEKIKSF
jgi:hypothetical protein